MENARAVPPCSFVTKVTSLLAKMRKNYLPGAADHQNQSEGGLMAPLGRLRAHGTQHKLANKALTKFTGEAALNVLALWGSSERALDDTRRQLETTTQKLRTAEELRAEAEARSTQLQNENDQLRATQPAVEVDPGEGPDLGPLEEHLARQAELQQECDDLRRCVQVGADQLRGLRDELAEAKDNLDRREEKAQGLADELLQLKERSRRQEEQRQKLQQAQDDLSACLLRMGDEMSEMATMRDQLRERLKQKGIAHSSLLRRFKEQEEAHSSQYKELVYVQACLEERDEEILTQHHAAQAYQEQVAALQAKVEKLQNEND